MYIRVCVLKTRVWMKLCILINITTHLSVWFYWSILLIEGFLYFHFDNNNINIHTYIALSQQRL